MTNNSNDMCGISHSLLQFLERSINNKLIIDLSDCDDYSFIFNELLHHFDVWFPKRIEIINY